MRLVLRLAALTEQPLTSEFRQIHAELRSHSGPYPGHSVMRTEFDGRTVVAGDEHAVLPTEPGSESLLDGFLAGGANNAIPSLPSRQGLGRRITAMDMPVLQLM